LKLLKTLNYIALMSIFVSLIAIIYSFNSNDMSSIEFIIVVPILICLILIIVISFYFKSSSESFLNKLNEKIDQNSLDNNAHFQQVFSELFESIKNLNISNHRISGNVSDFNQLLIQLKERVEIKESQLRKLQDKDYDSAFKNVQDKLIEIQKNLENEKLDLGLKIQRTSPLPGRIVGVNDLTLDHLTQNNKEPNIQISNRLRSKSNPVKFQNKVFNCFDNIYLVNLKKDKSEKFRAIFHLEKYGIKPEIFEAINGYDEKNIHLYNDYKSKPLGSLHYKEYSDLEIKRKSKFISSAGAFGYILTYMSIIEDAKKNGYRRILIFEDDVILDNNFEDRFDKFINSINPNWKMILLGASQYGWNSVSLSEAKLKGYYYPRILDTCGSFALGLDNSIYDELTQNLSHFDGPFDHIPSGKIYEKYLGHCFVSFPSMVIADVSTSNIRNNRDQYSHSVKMRWPLSRFEFPLSRLSVTVVSNSKKVLDAIWPCLEDMKDQFHITYLYYSNDRLVPLHEKSYLNGLELLPGDMNYYSILSQLNSDVVSIIDDSCQLDTENFSNYLESLLLNKEVEKLSGLEVFKKHKNGYSSINSDISIPLNSQLEDLVSIIITTYKRPNLARKAIRSVINQKYKSIEIIVVDDNGIGTEKQLATQRIVDKMAINKKLEIVYLPMPVNSGGSAARNAGIFRATGSYVAFLDDDDIYTPNKISDCINTLENLKGEYAGVYGGYLGWNSPSNDLNRYPKGDLTTNLLTLDYKSHYLHTNTTLFRKDAILKINGFNENFKRHQDLEFSLRFFQKFKIGSVNKIVCKLRPEPVKINNTLDGPGLFKVKVDFFKYLDDILNALEEESQNIIFDKHRLELVRYFKSEESLASYLKTISEDENLKFNNFFNFLKKHYLITI